MRIRLLTGKHSHLRQQLKSKGNIYRTSHYLKSCKSEVRTSRLARILDNLNAFLKPQDMNLHSYKLHELSGKEKGTWSVWIAGNWRVTFRFDGLDAVAVDYRDYH